MNTYHPPPAAPFSFDLSIQARERPAKRYRDEDEDDDDADIHPTGSYSPYAYDSAPPLSQPHAYHSQEYDDDASGEEMPDNSSLDLGKSRPPSSSIFPNPSLSRRFHPFDCVHVPFPSACCNDASLRRDASFRKATFTVFCACCSSPLAPLNLLRRLGSTMEVHTHRQ